MPFNHKDNIISDFEKECERLETHDTQQASTNYKEAFSLFDKRGTGRVPADSLGDLLRACGQNPTLAEIGDLEKGVGKECKFRVYPSVFPFSRFPVSSALAFV